MKSISDSLMADNLINFLAKVPKRPIEQSENKNTISEEEKENQKVQKNEFHDNKQSKAQFK